MGVLNVTPDSFSDGGRYAAPEDGVRRALEMADEGASIIDVGGESTRPGAEAVPAPEEWRRIAPVVEAVSRKIDVPISIDTRKFEVAEKAIERGASIVNDVSGLSDPKMIRLVATTRAGTVVMHMQGDPKTMQRRPRYVDVVREVRGFLEDRVKAARDAGVAQASIAVDPGIGFGKTVDQNLALLAGLDVIAGLGHPVVIGVSRKSFISTVTGGDRLEDRLPGSLAAAAVAVTKGANIVRAHDVAATVRAMRMADAVLRGRENL